MLALLTSSSTGAAGFASSFGDAITADNMWTSLTPFVGLMTAIFIFAFAFGVFKKLTKSGSKHKYNV